MEGWIDRENVVYAYNGYYSAFTKRQKSCNAYINPEQTLSWVK